MAFPGVAAALRPASRQAHPLIGLVSGLVSGSSALGCCTLTRYGSGPFDGETSSDVLWRALHRCTVCARVAGDVPVRTVAAHALLCGALLLPFVVGGVGGVCTDDGSDMNAPVVWGVIIAGVGLTIGAASAADRHLWRGPQRLVIPANGLAIGIVGCVTFLVGGVAVLGRGMIGEFPPTRYQIGQTS